MTFMGCSCLWMPTCPISSPSTYQPCTCHLWAPVALAQSSAKQARGQGAHCLCEHHLAMKDEHWEIWYIPQIPHSSSGMTWAYSTLWCSYPTGLNLSGPQCKLLDYMLLTLGTSLCSPIILLSFLISPPRKTTCVQIPILGSKLRQTVCSFWSSEGELFEMYKMLLSFFIWCYTFCLILCHISSMVPGYTLLKQTWNYK